MLSTTSIFTRTPRLHRLRKLARPGLTLGFIFAIAWGIYAWLPLEHTGVVDASSLTTRIDGVHLWRGKPFTGTAVSYYDDEPGYPNKRLKESIEFVNGKRDGLRLRWFPNERLAARLSYRNGRLDGLSESFWDNGNPRTRATYRAGRTHGVSTQWYREGMKFKERNLVDGREQGLQRAWRRNGKLYANYEAKNGRNYGLHQNELCFEVVAP